MKNRTIAFIFARGGSKGIPRKNLQPVGPLPIIALAVLCGNQLPEVERVIVSTDDSEIAETALAFGAEVPFLRPPDLASDTASEFLAWKHAVAETSRLYGPFDTFLSLPPTSPLRAPCDARNCLRELWDHPGTDLVLTVQEASRNPYFNMVTRNEDGSVRLAIQTENGPSRRQDAPPVFDVTTVAYAARASYVTEASSLLAGNIRAVEVPRIRAADVDDALDLCWVQFLIAKGHPDLVLPSF